MNRKLVWRRTGIPQVYMTGGDVVGTISRHGAQWYWHVSNGRNWAKGGIRLTFGAAKQAAEAALELAAGEARA